MAAKEMKPGKITSGMGKSNPGGKLKGGSPKRTTVGKPYEGPNARLKSSAGSKPQKAPYSKTTPKN